MAKKSRKLSVIDLFAGCGGLSLGFANSGFNVVAAFDNWDPAIEVYRRNFNHPIIKKDLSDTSDLKDIKSFKPDVIIGGPPCQDFSSAGHRNEKLGRADLTISFSKIIDVELLGNERFYRLLSERSNYIDPEVAGSIYLSLVYVIVDELRKHKFIRLPTLGDFAIVRQKSRPALIGRRHCIIDGMEILKFYPKHSFRGYFNERQKIQALSAMPPPPINSN